MTEEKNKSEIVKLKEWSRAIMVAGFCILVVAGMTAVFITIDASMWSEVMDDDHMTDPTIPYNEKGNATYTWSAQELMDRTMDGMWLSIPFLIIAAMGYVMIIAAPSDKRLHRIGCKDWKDVTYCPDCGIKMSRLEKDR